MIFTLLWGVAVALLFGGAAAMELGAIRRRIDGANGLVFLVAGLLGLATLPFGFVGLWWLHNLRTAVIGSAAVALVTGALWWALLQALDRAARAQR
ncbi:hypothetical protein [Roseateles sp.]|uniref:hypothetical protein n=1 Tax=Roseateles sp. TaxID=1971397 RepID=UPI0031D38CF6